MADTPYHAVTCAKASDHSQACTCHLKSKYVAEAVDHPDHYGGKDNPYEAIKIIEALGLDFWIGNCLKYIVRAGKKDPSKEIEDLEKARWYLDRKIQWLKTK